MGDLSIGEVEECWVSVDADSFTKMAYEILNMTCGQHINRILSFAPPKDDVKSMVEQVRKLHGPYMKEREAFIGGTRIAGCRQHGLKTMSDKPKVVVPVFRFKHSRSVAALGLILQLKVSGRSSEGLAAWDAGMGHDRAHPAYSHTVEHLMVEYYGIKPHEERGLSILLRDKMMVRYFLADGLEQDNIRLAIREEGDFVTQSIADTAAYVEHDGHFIGDPPSDDFLWRIAASVEGVKDGRIKLNDTAPIQEMLDRRAKYHQIFYSSYKGRVMDAAVTKLFWYALKEKIFTPEDVISEADEFIDERFLAMRTGKHNVPNWITSLLDLARGDMSELKRWKKEVFKAKDKFEARKKYLSDRRLDYIHVRTRALDSKTVKIIDPSGHELSLKADLKYNEDDLSWFIFTFK